MLRQLNEWDKPVLFDYLLRNEEEAAFLMCNSEQFGIMNRCNILRCGDYFGFFKGNTLVGVIAFYNMGNCFAHYEDYEAVKYFSQLMIIRRFSMLLGVKGIIEPLFEIIKHYKPIKELEECSYHVNYELKPFKLEGADFVDVSKDSSLEVLEFVRKAYLHGFDAERTLEGTRLLLSQKGEEEDFIILRAEDRMIAQACIQAVTLNTNQIGAVYTLLEDRGKGYGKAVVSELCERINGRGKLPTLIVNKQNTPALNAYTALGFEERGDYLMIRLYS